MSRLKNTEEGNNLLKIGQANEPPVIIHLKKLFNKYSHVEVEYVNEGGEQGRSFDCTIKNTNNSTTILFDFETGIDQYSWDTVPTIGMLEGYTVETKTGAERIPAKWHGLNIPTRKICLLKNNKVDKDEAGNAKFKNQDDAFDFYLKMSNNRKHFFCIPFEMFKQLYKDGDAVIKSYNKNSQAAGSNTNEFFQIKTEYIKNNGPGVIVDDYDLFVKKILETLEKSAF